MIEIEVVAKWDIIEQAWKQDWSEPVPEPVDIDVAIKVQIGVIADIIEEIKARHEIAAIIASQEPIVDPAVW